MSQSVFIASPEGGTGKSTVAYGVLDLLSRRVGRVGVFRPVTKSAQDCDAVLQLLLAHPAVDQSYESAVGVSYQAYHADVGASLAKIMDRWGALEADYDALVVLGSDYTDLTVGNEWNTIGTIAANLGAPVILVVHGQQGRTPEAVAAAAELAWQDLLDDHAQPVAVIANRVQPEDVQRVRELLRADGRAGGAIPEMPILTAPTVGDLITACSGELIRGNPEGLQRESMGFVVAAMALPNILTRIRDNVTVIAPGDRPDVLPALILAHHSPVFPPLASVILTGGDRPPEPVAKLIDGVDDDLPIAVTPCSTFDTANALSQVRGRLNPDSKVKVETALRIFAESVDTDALLRAIDVAESDVVTPLMFQYRLTERARRDRRHIVLPEGEEERILQAADSLLRLGVADLTLLGEENWVRAKAAAAGADISAARILSPHDPELVQRFAKEYASLRAHKNVTVHEAEQIVTDVSYFGTMMVHLGMADGMVSGSIHTTAHTIRPAFEIIKTVPGTSIVSSVFFMCLSDRVLVYGDCAVNPDPTADQLADIAVSSADTAAQFGVEPRVAMLSYSTGASGSGADVEKVRAATQFAREKRPDLLIEGPIQYDAAVDARVAATKLPDSQVAGRATVLIFPDLNTGNNTYKAVQRSAGAVAIGPVLQGLNKPVNDLSRGALVADIVNTVAITAIQAQDDGAA